MAVVKDSGHYTTTYPHMHPPNERDQVQTQLGEIALYIFKLIYLSAAQLSLGFDGNIGNMFDRPPVPFSLGIPKPLPRAELYCPGFDTPIKQGSQRPPAMKVPLYMH